MRKCAILAVAGLDQLAAEGMRFTETFVDFPPMQKGASFNLEALKSQLQQAVQKHGP